jgi:hypothetical protein
VPPTEVARAVTVDANPPLGCSLDQGLIRNSEEVFFSQRDRYGSMNELHLRADRRHYRGSYRVELWQNGAVYLLMSVKGKGCELPGASAKFVASAARYCEGVQQAVDGFQDTVLRGVKGGG